MFRNVVIALSSAYLVACGGASSSHVDNEGGGNEDGGIAPPSFIPYVADTSEAIAFGFTTDQTKSSLSTTRKINGTATCEQLVKVTEVREPIENEDEHGNVSILGFKTRKVFTESGTGNCQIYEIYAMQQHLVMRGNFTKLADIHGGEVKRCLMVSIPLSETAAPMSCILKGSHEENGGWTREVSEIFSVDVNPSGNKLIITSEIASEDRDSAGDDMQELATLLWMGGDFSTLYTQTRVRELGSNQYRAYIGDGPFFAQYNPLFPNKRFELFEQEGTELYRLYDSDTAFSGQEIRVSNWLIPARVLFSDPSLNTRLGLNLLTGQVKEVELTSPYGDKHTLFSLSQASNRDTNFTIGIGSFTGWGEIDHQALVKINNNNLEIEGILLFDESSPFNWSNGGAHRHQAGNTDILYSIKFDTNNNETIVIGYDIKTQTSISNYRNLLAGSDYEGFELASFKFITNGLMLSGRFNGESLVIFYDQLSKTWTTEVLDSTEISGSVPLLP